MVRKFGRYQSIGGRGSGRGRSRGNIFGSGRSRDRGRDCDFLQQDGNDPPPTRGIHVPGCDVNIVNFQYYRCQD